MCTCVFHMYSIMKHLPFPFRVLRKFLRNSKSSTFTSIIHVKKLSQKQHIQCTCAKCTCAKIFSLRSILEVFYWQIKICTCPSHISMRGVLLVAFSSLKWNSFPSKKFQGRHMFHGIGAPHTSLANTAVSTPDIKREARWIPRGNTLGSYKANIIFIQILFCALLNKNKNLL